MREFKFRIWSRKVNTWLLTKYWGMNFDGKIIYPVGADCDDSDCIIQQYTGVKIGGVECYEGDIVEGRAKKSFVGSVGFVFWNKKASGFYIGKDSNGLKWSSSALSGGRLDPKIIGNICENPELVKEHGLKI